MRVILLRAALIAISVALRFFSVTARWLDQRHPAALSTKLALQLTWRLESARSWLETEVSRREMRR